MVPPTVGPAGPYTAPWMVRGTMYGATDGPTGPVMRPWIVPPDHPPALGELKLGRYEIIYVELLKSSTSTLLIASAETNIRYVTNEPSSKRTNIRIFVRFDD